MSDERRRRWEERHHSDDTVGAPSPFVVRALDVLAAHRDARAAPLRALDVACGRGRHTLLLAAHGYRVTALDYALPALVRLRTAAAARGLVVDCLAADATTVALPRDRYALVVVVNFLERLLFPALRAAVAPGGALLYETHLRDDATATVLKPEFLLAPGELEHLCWGWRILSHETGTAPHGDRAGTRAGILAERPHDPIPHAPVH